MVKDMTSFIGSTENWLKIMTKMGIDHLTK